MNTGTLYILSAASGTGKTSLSKALVKIVKNVEISISHTTRSIRPGEQEGKSYFSISETTFQEMIKNGQFLEYANVFGDYYGTSKEFVLQKLNAGIDVILDIDWQGAKQVREKMPNCVSIFLLPPSKTALRERLEKRNRDSSEIIEKRLRIAGDEIMHYHEFDYIVVNDKFSQALRDIKAIMHATHLKQQAQARKYAKLIKDLTKIK